MIQLKNKLLKIVALGLVIATLASFNDKQLFDGGTISNPNMVIIANTRPPEITATNASGCGGTITYQWQQSTDAVNFIDIVNATGASYQPGVIATMIHFRRKATCQGGVNAYTNNMATVVIAPSPN